MSSPNGGVPIPSMPVSSPQSNNSRKRSKILQSSLELAFSYARHQQLRYGGSAPSFIESSSSKSFTAPRTSDAEDQENSPFEQEDRDVSGRWADIEAAAGRDRKSSEFSTRSVPQEPEIVFEEEEEEVAEDDPITQDQYRRASDEPSFFHLDPIQAEQSDTQSEPPSTSTASPVKPTPSGQSLLRFPTFSPRVTSSTLGSSLGTRSNGSQTPRPGRDRRILEQVDIEARDLEGRENNEYTSLVARDGMNYGTRLSEEDVVIIQSKVKAGGQSTDGQTLFNATAVLVGIGLLSMPLAFAYAGWLGGVVMLLGFGWLTCHTAKLLARLIRADPKLMGYTDIGVRALGIWAGGGIHILFCLELFALGVALVVLFGDTLNALYPYVTSNHWKIIGFFIILPTTLLPLRLLSLPSLLSSVSSLLLVLILLVDGFIRKSAPGSLRDPMSTSVWPEWTGANWLGGVGLVLAGFGGHAVMPSLAKDMKYPENFEKVVNKAFTIATIISFIAGAAGYLMIGQGVSDEITRDLMQERYHYPRALNLIALWMIVINPLTKFGLSSRPLNLTLEDLIGISPYIPSSVTVKDSAFSSHDDVDALDSATKSDRDERHSFSSSSPNSPSQRSGRASRGFGESDWSYRTTERRPSLNGRNLEPISLAKERRKAVLRVISRTIVTALCVLVAVLLPGFGRVMAFLGSFSAFLICIILPLVFYLRLAPRLKSGVNTRRTGSDKWSAFGHWFLVVICTILMIAGTIWAFLPGSGHGELDL
ncbi:uncharacterized protein I206_106790 [Kwoniella pini CBS 10737]|uniref:Amino acid transporter transmembrane domain-containing protein n=1 Tax=Kwoniella pini CBS 10737 TaxID=1296096 RepID=A0A1B9HT80_9TREE|nr:uncharacterized protein I206_07323 [Kwoniella pini CBS 10737]OCF46470.1 hypothetical protein I206_07323 [Kwoniella pini CBS 10737]